MKEIKFDHFEVSNITDHGLRGQVVARAATRFIADQIVNASHYLAVDHVTETLFIVDSIGEYLALKEQDIRNRALAKLTVEEKAALGL